MAKPYKSVLTRRQLEQLAGVFLRRLEVWLEPRLGPFFDRLAERFLDLADGAGEDALRQEYLHAGRELQRRREGLERAFHNNLLKATEAFFLHYEVYLEEFIHGFTANAGRPDALELVNDEKLEEDLVVLRIAYRAASALQPEHKEITAYMAAVVQPKELPPGGTPLSPQVMANCLRMALAGWTSGAASRFVFYQVLAERLMPDLAHLYPVLVEALKKTGLEPVETKVKRAPMRQRSLPLSPPEKAGPRAGGGERRVDGEEAALFSVIHLMRQLGEEDKELLGMVGSLVAAGAPAGSAMKPDTLVELLHELQESIPPDVEELEQARAHQAQWKQELVSRLRRATESRRQRLHLLDQQILDIVTMLFDFVLDDTLIPDSMKVLLVRLQAPVLQIAIHDKSFLTDSRHPARRLVNNLSRAAVRWAEADDASPDSVYGMIRRSVERILHGDARDPELYREVNREFEAFLAQEERGARVAEERVSQVARGKEQLAVARRRVGEALDGLLARPLPEVVRQILSDAWRDVLTLILLREGEESDAWRHALEVARRLADSAAGAAGPGRRRERFVEEVPRLLGELRRGFASISYDSKKAAQLLERLQSCHRAASQGAGAVSMACGDSAALSEVGPADDGELEPWLRRVRALKEGDWVRWQVPAGERRGKLAWRSEIADLLLFVDMRGRKLAEHSSRELAALFRSGQASLLSHIDQPFMERALRSLQKLLSRRVSRGGPRILPA